MKIQQSVNFKENHLDKDILEEDILEEDILEEDILEEDILEEGILEENMNDKAMTTEINAQSSPSKKQINPATLCPPPVKKEKTTPNQPTATLSSLLEKQEKQEKQEKKGEKKKQGKQDLLLKLTGKKNLEGRFLEKPLYVKDFNSNSNSNDMESESSSPQKRDLTLKQEKQDEKKINKSKAMPTSLESYQQDDLKLAYQSRNKAKQKNQKLKQSLQTLEQEKYSLKEDLQQTQKHTSSLQEEINVLRDELGQLEAVIQSRKTTLIERLKEGEKKLFESIEKELPLGKQITFLQKLSADETRFKREAKNDVLPSLDASRGEMLQRAKPIAAAFEKLMKNPRSRLK